jgi:hypothetical protein
MIVFGLHWASPSRTWRNWVISASSFFILLLLGRTLRLSDARINLGGLRGGFGH